jgi:hypothetical protein
VVEPDRREGVVIDNPAWNLVRETLRALNDPEATMPDGTFGDAERAFLQIEREVEKLVRDYNGNLQAERDLRNALEADTAPGAEIRRRG